MKINLDTMTEKDWNNFLYEVAAVREKNKDPFLNNLVGTTINCFYSIYEPFPATATTHKDYQYLSSHIRLFNEYCKLHNYDLEMFYPNLICWDKDDHKGNNSDKVSKYWLED